MKHMIFALTFALFLGGCSPFELPSIDISTPVTRNTLYGAVNGYGVALSAANTYKNLCVQQLADAGCRGRVVAMQKADAKASARIDAANKFIKTYPTVDAGNLISAASAAVTEFKLIAGAK